MYYTEHKPKNKMWEAWERGYNKSLQEASIGFCLPFLLDIFDKHRKVVGQRAEIEARVLYRIILGAGGRGGRG